MERKPGHRINNAGEPIKNPSFDRVVIHRLPVDGLVVELPDAPKVASKLSVREKLIDRLRGGKK